MIFNYEPQVLESDVESIVDCINLGIANPKNNIRVEAFLSNMFSLPCALTSSGTASLHSALIASGVGPGDEVLCSDLTFSATWNVIEYVGATPVFVDVKEDTWCMNPLDLLSKITDRSKAIITVDLFGNSCDYSKIKDISRRSGLKIVQDAAESLGTRYNGKEIFEMGDISCTSFNLNKIITSCGGGAVFSSNQKSIKKIKQIINQNKISNGYDYHGIGFNYRMGSINSALLVSQAGRLEEILSKKEEIRGLYFKNLSDADVKFQKSENNSIPNNWVNVIMFKDTETRDICLDLMIKNEVEAKKIFKPGTMVEWVSEKYGQKVCEVSRDLFRRCLMLPSSLSISREEVKIISNIVRSVA